MKVIFKTLKTDDGEYSAVVHKLNNCFKPKVNVTHERYELIKEIILQYKIVSDVVKSITWHKTSCKIRSRKCNLNVTKRIIGQQVSDSSSDFESELASEESLALSCNR